MTWPERGVENELIGLAIRPPDRPSAIAIVARHFRVPGPNTIGAADYVSSYTCKELYRFTNRETFAEILDGLERVYRNPIVHQHRVIVIVDITETGDMFLKDLLRRHIRHVGVSITTAPTEQHTPQTELYSVPKAAITTAIIRLIQEDRFRVVEPDPATVEVFENQIDGFGYKKLRQNLERTFESDEEQPQEETALAVAFCTWWGEVKLSAHRKGSGRKPYIREENDPWEYMRRNRR